MCPANTKSFRKMCYSFQPRYMKWLDANNECKRLGGQLATIELLSVNQFFFRNYRQSQKLNVWIGLTKCNSRWCHPDGSASAFRRWNSGEPNNVGGNENCVEMWNNGYWNDAPCATQRRPSICEIPAGIHLSIEI